MTGPVDAGVQLAGGFMDSLKKEPLSLALVVMNLALLGFFWLILSAISQQREREVNLLYEDKKEVRELIAKCVVPERRTSYSPISTPAVRDAVGQE